MSMRYVYLAIPNHSLWQVASALRAKADISCTRKFSRKRCEQAFSSSQHAY